VSMFNHHGINADGPQYFLNLHINLLLLVIIHPENKRIREIDHDMMARLSRWGSVQLHNKEVVEDGMSYKLRHPCQQQPYHISSLLENACGSKIICVL
jgi:hypothetical protein